MLGSRTWLTTAGLILFQLHSAQAEASPLGAEDASLLWGTYRPNLYFGLKPMIPESFVAGLMWFGLHDFQSFMQIRHSCEQNDGLAGYTWTEHDLREGGVQVLKDPKNNVEITTEFLKVPGGEHGGSWAARIKGKPIDTALPMKTSMIFYFGLEGIGSVEMDSDEDGDGLEGVIEFSGNAPGLDDFKLRFRDGPNNQYITEGPAADDFARKLGKTHYAGFAVPGETVWRAKDYIAKSIVEYAQPLANEYQQKGFLPEPAFLLSLPDESYASSNLFAIQKSFEGEFEFDVYYDSASAGTKLDASAVTKGIQAFQTSFTERFQKTFPVPSDSPKGHLEFSKAISSNLFGGIGYFYGSSIEDVASTGYADDDDDDDVPQYDDEMVDDEEMKRRAKPMLTVPRGLLTATPSRPFFPRGFYWDEGFHLEIVGAWDNDLSLEILKSWVNLINDDGWVGREQILGEEARSKVPQEFQTQYPTYANPPTLTMAITSFISRLRASSDPMADQLGFQQDPSQLHMASTPASSAPLNTVRLLEASRAREYLSAMYPKIRRHYDWFRRTQRGQIKQWNRSPRSKTEAYRWRGRSAEHVLTSGLDDYPRAKSHIGELHVDLISWVGFFTKTMKQIAEFLGEREDEEMFRGIEKDILMNLDDLHWSEEQQMYCDASVDDEDESYHECHKGYVSLFPFLLGILPPDSPRLGAILDLIRDPEHLWSPYGIRSLSASHPLFGKGENYWKGPIWVQMNYLALSALHKTYAAEPGPHQAKARQIYADLRKNIIDNVFTEYERTGYVWEQYDAITGQGLRSHPFTGWTSLVTLIISEKY